MTARTPDWTAKVFALLLLACAPALSACQTDAPAGPSAQAASQGASKAAANDEPPTRQEAALQCWSSVDKAHPTMGLDQRADIVTKCINDKMKTQPAAPKPPKSKT